MTALLTEIAGNIAGISGQALGAIKTRAEALAKSVEVVAEDVAADIVAYGDKIVRTIDCRVRREMTAADCHYAIKNWKQSMKSALKKLKVFSEWEVYDQFWGHVESVFKIVSALLGEIVL